MIISRTLKARNMKLLINNNQFNDATDSQGVENTLWGRLVKNGHVQGTQKADERGIYRSILIDGTCCSSAAQRMGVFQQSARACKWIILLCILGLMGCAIDKQQQAPLYINKLEPPFKNREILEPYSDISLACYQSADILTNVLNQRNVELDKLIIAASFVNINNLEESSTFGRVISEQIVARLSQNGYRIKELRLRNNSILIKEGLGELLLSREMKNISKNQDAFAVLVGTYAIAEDIMFVSTRIVSTSNDTIIAAHSFQIEINPTIDCLLGSSQK